MPNVTLYHDCRRLYKDGTAPLKLSVLYGNIRIYVPADLNLTPRQWDSQAREVINHPKKKQLNEFLDDLVFDAEMTVRKLKRSNRRVNAKELTMCIQNNDAEATENVTFMEFFRRVATDETKKPRTREIYEATRKKLVKFAASIKVNPEWWTFEDITRSWVSKFDKWLMADSPSKNARNIHLRNIRHVCNEAVAEHLTTFYDFKAIHLKQEETAKRSLTVEQLRQLFGVEVEKHQQKYLDMFKLIFYLIGINTVDLCHLRKENVRDGRIEYKRSKTGRLYSIKLEPEAMEIINRYAGAGEWLLDMLDRYKDFRDYAHRLNDNLSLLGPVVIGKHGKKERKPMFPDLTTYWARHTWATIAASLDIPNETIAAALGHGYGNRITAIYIDFDRQKVDDANRKVLDWVLYQKL